MTAADPGPEDRSGSNTAVPCRALVGGFGRPGQRDLDFGRQLVDYLRELAWPEGVVVEDLSCAVPLVLHRLQELRPAKVVLLGSVPRELDPPGTVRRYQAAATAADPTEVQRGLEESVGGFVDIDHTLAVARHWGGLPADTVVIEVEPAEICFGTGFSEELAGCIDPILDLVRAEVGDGGAEAELTLHVDSGDLSTSDRDDGILEATPAAEAQAVAPSEAMTELVGYARQHADACLRSGHAPSLTDELPSAVPGLALAGRVRPWGVFAREGADWFDAVPLGPDRVGIVVGEVAGRGVEVAAAMRDLRAALRAYVVLDGGSPAQVVRRLDRLAEVTGLGRHARLLYLTLEPVTGEVRFATAGACPPLVLDRATREGRFVEVAGSLPVGAAADAGRPEATLRLAAGSTLLLFTDGLVQSRAVPRTAGLEQLRRAADEGPAPLEELCEHVLSVCTGPLRRDDDICLLAVRRLALPAPPGGVAQDPDEERAALYEVPPA